MNVTTVEVNVTTKDRHYLVVKVNCSDVHYHIVVKVNTCYFTFFILILMWLSSSDFSSDRHYLLVMLTTQVVKRK